MQAFKLNESKILRKIISINNFKGENQKENSSLNQESANSRRCFYHQTKRFQEIVPLNAANVLGPQNRKIPMKWNSLIGAALNNRRPIKVVEEDKIAEPQKVYPLKEQICEDGQEFQCIISRQMVGMFITIWVRCDLYQSIRHLSVSSVGCGIMGCLGNKPSSFWWERRRPKTKKHQCN
ncbi:Endonuclease/exonuclease/phosphatase superfamily [Sesbania bispinosa]|nr:Endonuclease/exonuclease/phosphatase superfamily [Sesbania bispinosa]